MRRASAAASGGAGSNLSPFTWRASPTPTDPDHITILGGWDTLNITTFECAALARATHGRARMVTMNHRVRPAFLALWEAWEKADLFGLLQPIVWGGAYNPRYKRRVHGAPIDAPRELSPHASGHAFDICAQRYPLGRAIPAEDPMQHFAAVARCQGWKWGGDFKRRPDGMHFQHVSSPFQ